MSLPLAYTNNIVEPSIRARVVRPMCVCYIQTSHSLCTGGDSHLRKGRFGVLVVIPAAIIFLMAHTARTQSRSSASKPAAAEKKAAPAKSARRLSPAASQWVESTLRKMSVDEKIGQLLFATYHGSFTSTDAAAYAQMLHCVNDLHVGGFINITQGSPLGIVKSQAYPTAVLTNQLQAKEKVPLLIGADFERGAAMRL